MKKTILFMIFFSLSSYATDKSELILDSPEKRVPERASGMSEESEYLMESGNMVPDVIENRQVKENQEETDPIFYDSTTSPAEIEPSE